MSYEWEIIPDNFQDKLSEIRIVRVVVVEVAAIETSGVASYVFFLRAATAVVLAGILTAAPVGAACGGKLRLVVVDMALQARDEIGIMAEVELGIRHCTAQEGSKAQGE